MNYIWCCVLLKTKKAMGELKKLTMELALEAVIKIKKYGSKI